VPGSSRESFDRQLKGYDPPDTERRRAAMRAERV